MEEIMDKLKLLDYEAGFCKKLKFKPFPRQILMPYTPSTQINYFITSTGTILLFLLTLESSSMHSPIWQYGSSISTEKRSWSSLKK